MANQSILNAFERMWYHILNGFNDLQSQVDDKLPLEGGTMWGQITLPSNPTSDMQAATKQYVDNLIGNILNGAS